MKKIKIGILGCGNLGKSAAFAVKQYKDMELTGVFTRRDPAQVEFSCDEIRVFPAASLQKPQDIDVLLLCGGSASDLPAQSPCFAELYHIVDSFDNHGKISEHFAAVDQAAKKGGKLALISAGWDPGLFSVSRAVGSAVLPEGRTYTFWGKGVSQGHSEAIRQIKGVADARQYTVPVRAALEAVRRGEEPEFVERDRHHRECFVAAEPEADVVRIEREIVTMPGYFAEYDTKVHFVDREEIVKNHSRLPHGGTVIRCGKTGAKGDERQLCEFRLKLSSNPDFTAGVLLACARAVFRLAEQGETGARTVLDLAPALLLPEDPDTQRRLFL